MVAVRGSVYGDKNRYAAFFFAPLSTGLGNESEFSKIINVVPPAALLQPDLPYAGLITFAQFYG